LDLWAAFQDAARSPAGTRDWNRVYRLTDGEARRPSLLDGTGDGSPGPAPLRAFSEKLLALMAGAPISLEPWTGFSQSPWVYGPGAGLEWHSDTGWLGAYIYYMHPLWHSSWGGELLVASGDTPPSGGAASGDSRSAVEAVCRSGGVFIYPRPNRLVLLRGGTLHCIKKVEGTASRASVSGFFFNTDNPPASS